MMIKQFTVKWLDKQQVCNGYAESSQLCADLVKRGIYPQIVIQYMADSWDEKMVDSNASNFIE